MTVEELKKIRETTLKNAESLLNAAKILTGEEYDHIRYHLAALALEEVGKVDLLGMRHTAAALGRPTEWLDRQLDNHVKKLFWAIWGPSFGQERITGEQIELKKELAADIHGRRLFYLYSDPEVPLLPKEKVDHKHVERLVGLTEARIGLARAYEVGEPDPSRMELMKWFAEATEDPEKGSQIFGNKSMQKLTELGDVSAWIAWLQEVYREHDEEMRRLGERELRRMREGEKEDAEADKPKWRLKIRLYSHSHSIRQKVLNAWNERSDFIKLTSTGRRVFSRKKKDEMLCEFILPRRIPIDALWHHGWGLSRVFVTALNIGARGLFWWYVPRDTERYYEEIWDLEQDAGVQVQPSPRLEIAWGDPVLEQSDLSHTAMVFGYISRIKGEKIEKALDAYVSGLTFFSKIDWHFRLEVNAFEEFWKAFRLALQATADWDGTEDLKVAAARQLGEILQTTENLETYIDLGTRLEEAKAGTGEFPEITLTEIVGMKLYCDLYLLKVSRRHFEKYAASKSSEQNEK